MPKAARLPHESVCRSLAKEGWVLKRSAFAPSMMTSGPQMPRFTTKSSTPATPTLLIGARPIVRKAAAPSPPYSTTYGARR